VGDVIDEVMLFRTARVSRAHNHEVREDARGPEESETGYA
jgi:hypothetical protein